MTAHPSTSRDLYVTTSWFPRSRLLEMPLTYELSCTPSSGWVLWRLTPTWDDRDMIAAEHSEGRGLRVDVGGVVIVDSLSADDEETPS